MTEHRHHNPDSDSAHSTARVLRPRDHGEQLTLLHVLIWWEWEGHYVGWLILGPRCYAGSYVRKALHVQM